MNNAKRYPRTYKIETKPYYKALKRGNGQLATIIEMFVGMYAAGANVIHIEEDILFGLKQKSKHKPSKAKQ